MAAVDGDGHFADLIEMKMRDEFGLVRQTSCPRCTQTLTIVGDTGGATDRGLTRLPPRRQMDSRCRARPLARTAAA